MIKCKNCGETILSDRPIRCPFCGVSYEEPKVNYCPTCSAGFTGSECPRCGDLINSFGHSFYQEYIAEQEKKRKP